MLATPPFGASSNIALWRAYSKPPVELVVADLEIKNKKRSKNGGVFMRKFKAVDAVCIMVLAGIAGFFIGAFFDSSMGGAILFSMIAGFACVVHAIVNKEE